MSELSEPTCAPEESPSEAHAAGMPLRVAWVASQRTIESLSTSLKPLAIALMDELVSLQVVCPGDADASDLPSPPIEILPYSPRRWWELTDRAVRQVSDEMSSRKTDLVHALDGGAAPLALRAAQSAGLPCLVSCRGLDDAGVLRKGTSALRAITAAAERIQQDLLERRVVSADRVYLLRPGLVVARRPACFTGADRSAAIVAAGTMDDFASFDAVLRSFAALRGKGHDCVFFLVGNGKSERRLRVRADRLALRSVLTFVDGQPAWRMAQILKAADIYVAPAPNREVDAQALLAMASGVPVIGAPAEASDFLKAGRTALQFPRGDDEALTDRLASLLEDRAAARGLAETALDYIRKHHSPADACARTVDLYRRTVAESRPGAG